MKVVIFRKPTQCVTAHIFKAHVHLGIQCSKEMKWAFIPSLAFPIVPVKANTVDPWTTLGLGAPTRYMVENARITYSWSSKSVVLQYPQFCTYNFK